MKISFYIVCALAVTAGLSVAWIDTRPTWDDAGITAMMVLVMAFVFGSLAGQKPWLIALATSIWVPLSGIILTHNAGGVLALIPGFIGSYAGYFIRRNCWKA
jgi:uncharacterized membrane protein (DUF4010 family)